MVGGTAGGKMRKKDIIHVSYEDATRVNAIVHWYTRRGKEDHQISEITYATDSAVDSAGDSAGDLTSGHGFLTASRNLTTHPFGPLTAPIRKGESGKCPGRSRCM